MTIPMFMTPGSLELFVVLLLALLLFGANRVPKVARSMGEAVTEFQTAMQNPKSVDKSTSDLTESDGDE